VSIPAGQEPVSMKELESRRIGDEGREVRKVREEVKREGES
jgi:hypothetical protein